MLRAPPKFVQQIAFLIITFSLDVLAIRNEAVMTPMNYQRPAAPPASSLSSSSTTFKQQFNYPIDDFLTQASQSRPPTSDAFRPSQILQFTVSDAATTIPQERYPPTYAEASNYLGGGGGSAGAGASASASEIELRYDTEKRFAFPEGVQQQKQQLYQQQQQQQTPNQYHQYQYNNQYQQPTSSTSLPTIPILSYADPYTNQNYHTQHTQPTTGQSQPQEFTVQSSMLVDAGQQRPHRPLGSEQMRPGYVVDEHPASSAAVHYTNYHNRAQPETTAKYQYHTQSADKPKDAPHPNAIGERLSYDSHDYPPPSYFQQHTSNFQSPTRQEVPTTAPSPTHAPAARPSSNYANNYGNYLQGDGSYEYPAAYQTQQLRPPAYRPQPSPPFQQQQQQYVQASYTKPRPTPPPGYFQYQLGEVPPSGYPAGNGGSGLHYGSFNPAQSRPPPPQGPPPHRPASPPQSPGGLATLASLFSGTQQYAPQFTSLLRPQSSNPLGSFLGALNGGGGFGGGPVRPPTMQLIRALENIARNDDLQCVPKVLCQTIGSQTQRGQLPAFITSPAITNFLAGFPATSPALIYGRAALLGISGGDRSCMQTYSKCPKNEYEIINYLNNHRGGFFKFFSEPEEHNHQSHQTGGDEGGASGTLFSILSALTGNGLTRPPTTTTTSTTPRPLFSIGGIGLGGGGGGSGGGALDGIGNFFTKVLSDYLGGVEHQRRRRRNVYDNEDVSDITDDEDFHDDEDDEDTKQQHEVNYYDDDDDDAEDQAHNDIEGRILAKKTHSSRFFPGDHSATSSRDDMELKLIRNFNAERSQKKLKFPSATAKRLYLQQEDDKRDNDEDQDKKPVVFKDHDESESDANVDDVRGERLLHEPSSSSSTKTEVVFPDEKRRGRILNRRPPYASSYTQHGNRDDYNEVRDRFVVAESHRQGHYQQQATNSHSYMSSQRPSYTASTMLSNHNYGAQHNNRYGSQYASRVTTRRPIAVHEDDRNVYVTNGQGITTHYLTPEGHKVPL